MSDQDQKVGAISTFLQRLEKVTGTKKGLLYYRGHSKSSYQLEPSVYRNSGWIANEATMLKELILRCPNDFSGGISTFQSLVKMQHYSLPTRLLDLTSNPLVALYFACAAHPESDEDGEVIVLRYGINQVKYYDSDTVSVIANLSRRPINFKVPLDGDVDTFNGGENIKLLLHDVRQDKPYFESKIRPGDLGKVLCVKPKLDNPRIIRQDGAFLLFGVDGDKAKAASLEDNSVVERIKINRDKKKELSTQLEALGISKATMFPEIEQVATHIRDSYTVPILDLNRLSGIHKRIFLALNQGDEKSVHEIAKELDITAMTASRMISKLNEMGFVERQGSGRDVSWKAKETIKVAKA